MPELITSFLLLFLNCWLWWWSGRLFQPASEGVKAGKSYGWWSIRGDRVSRVGLRVGSTNAGACQFQSGGLGIWTFLYRLASGSRRFTIIVLLLLLLFLKLLHTRHVITRTRPVIALNLVHQTKMELQGKHLQIHLHVLGNPDSYLRRPPGQWALQTDAPYNPARKRWRTHRKRLFPPLVKTEGLRPFCWNRRNMNTLRAKVTQVTENRRRKKLYMQKVYRNNRQNVNRLHVKVAQVTDKTLYMQSTEVTDIILTCYMRRLRK